MARQILAYVLAVLATLAEVAVTATRMVWRAGRWVLESVTPAPRRAPAAAAGAADAAAALAEASQAPVGVPAAVALAKPEPVDPVLEWGTLAHKYANAQSVITGEDDPILDGILDEPAIAWLTSLTHVDLLQITNATPRDVGRHMLGEREIPGLKLCPTMREWEQSKRSMASITAEMRERLAEGRQAMQDALDDLVNNPSWEPLRGV
ncbi:hypothetical protein [Methylobacterium trifolii]|uniref:Uncharacterized protein n=2 Tax=Methylobacterium TaxID=407 RepID=A0ABQ4TZ09_9HYPH|nr:hypothetical protein [Methylobacterium trifolii]GJE59779.1 hypothetical protein MPOCJGCO_1881 [Methylobacterium trifolii]